MESLAFVLIGAVVVSAGARPLLYAQQPTQTETASISDQAARDTPAQQSPLEKRVSIMVIDEPLSQALATISTQSGVRLTYSSDDLPPAKRVSFAERNVSVGTALQLVLAGTSLQAVAIQDGAIVLTARGVRPAADASSASEVVVVTGRVVDPAGSPIHGATIGLAGTEDTIASGDSGGFRIRGIAPGTYVLWVRRVGFRVRSMPITVSAALSPVTVTLVPTVATLPTVTTTQVHPGYHEVGFDQRMRAGTGAFITYEQIARDHAARLTQLLQGLHGVVSGELPWGYDGAADMDGSRELAQSRGVPVDGMWAQGSCVAFAIDGVARGVLDSRDIDNLIDVSDVGAIEIYSASGLPGSVGPGTSRAEMPLTLVGGRDLVPPHCTLVVIWTRQRLGIPSAAVGSVIPDTVERAVARSRDTSP